MSRETGFRLGALGCCVVYILCFLFLPFMMFRELGSPYLTGASGINCLSVSIWAFLILFSGIAAGICTLTVHSKPAAIVCLVAAFIPVAAYFLIRWDVIRSLGGGSAAETYIMSKVFETTVGVGLVLSLLSGIGAAVLCFFSDFVTKPTQRTPGLTANPDDEW